MPNHKGEFNSRILSLANCFPYLCSLTADSVERRELETIAVHLEKTNTSLLNSVTAYQIIFLGYFFLILKNHRML